MFDFTYFANEQVVDSLLQNYADLGAGNAPHRNNELTLRGLEIGHGVIERRAGDFAIIARTDRKHDGVVGQLIHIQPQAN